MILVKFEHDWADEFTVYGLKIMTQREYDQLIDWAKDASWGFGSNQCYENDDISDGFSIVAGENSEGIAVIANYLLGHGNSWGNFPDYKDDLYNRLWEEFPNASPDDLDQIFAERYGN